MIDILAAGIILHGNANGVWSPSHPDIFPYPESHAQTISSPVRQVEERYIPETPLTDGHGNLIFPHRLH